uniref:Uncharacterized protein n=1 Tax=viral metagenome TaxID=1070528 RepID=A0A6H2A5N0_9ZZZZ
MKCPLISSIVVELDAPWELKEIDCLKEECAWWDEVETVCMWKSIHRNLEYIALKLGNIAEVMPFIEQFTKKGDKQ